MDRTRSQQVDSQILACARGRNWVLADGAEPCVGQGLLHQSSLTTRCPSSYPQRRIEWDHLLRESGIDQDSESECRGEGATERRMQEHQRRDGSPLGRRGLGPDPARRWRTSRQASGGDGRCYFPWRVWTRTLDDWTWNQSHRWRASYPLVARPWEMEEVAGDQRRWGEPQISQWRQ